MNPGERDRWAGTLTSAGWLFLLSYLAIIATQLDRARRTTSSRFEDGVWGQRIEQVSFAALPQNLVVLVPAVAVAVAAGILTREVQRDIWVDRLVRGTAGAAFVALLLAALGLVDVMFQTQDAAGDFAAVVNRVGGIAMALGMIKLCLHAEREASTPPDDR